MVFGGTAGSAETSFAALQNGLILQVAGNTFPVVAREYPIPSPTLQKSVQKFTQLLSKEHTYCGNDAFTSLLSRSSQRLARLNTKRI